MRFAIAMLTAVLLPAGFAPTQETQNQATKNEKKEDQRPPNIVLILADDLGYGDVGCYNPDSSIPTPNVDRLASEGVRFTDAHSPSTVCTPTRYSVMTGRMAFRLDYRGVFTGAGGPCLITEDRLTLPAMLKQRGYRTAMFGKWHIGLTFFDKDGNKILKNGLGPVQRIDYSRAIPDAPIHRGFDEFYGTACCPTTDWLYAYIDGDRIPVPPSKRLDKSTLPKHPWANDCRRGMVADDFDLEEVDMVFLKKSLEFLDRHHEQSPEQPFFLFHSLQAVHLPSFASKQFQGKSGAGPHGDFLLQFDHVVGALDDKLRQLGIADDTLVIVTSDNGPEVGTVLNMRERHQHDGAKPWRGMKRDNWEGGHRVPFVAKWPGRIQKGTTSDQTLCLTDLMATCAAVADCKLPPDAAEDSYDMLPALLGTAEAPIREYTLHQTISLALAIRQGDWKYLDHKGSGGNNYQRNKKLEALRIEDTAPDAPGQLYNLKLDPKETTNRYFQAEELAKMLDAKLEQAKTSGRSAPLPAVPVLTTFAWPTPADVVVTDRTEKDGRTATTRYRLAFARHEDGESWRARHRDFEFLTVQGRDVKTPQMQRLIANSEALGSIIPDYRIDADGNYVETIDLPAMLERMTEILADRPGYTKERIDKLRAEFRRPQFNELMQGTLAKYWNCWVGAWTEWDVPSGSSRTERVLRGSGADKIPFTVTYRHLGEAEDHPGCVHLSLRAEARGPETVAWLVQEFSDYRGEDMSELQAQIEFVETISHLEVITDPKTLRPRWARTESGHKMKRKGDEKATEKIERHEFTFEWPK